ncbi:TetR/AcrR family transcriptional regulator [Paenibacillus thermoaerophilus]|uniref:TetR/AcrR family transcriptional regulator n=1 Tax=Paenibacillus thermoaerophilus TaxID=1215385 RepID=A0ABW2V0I7_9BACL|nr:TetR/AcrR family transcriptional regulator [Paenibacillus thermoaerophilus]TMV11012.1 TetR/AcrR family transcriptional regulator [Paenibacillus thermoaerophilus]
MDRKQEILKAAAHSFANYGYKATTVDRVSKIAKVGKGTIYTFFADKEELFGEIVQQVILEMKEIAERAIKPDRTFFENLHDVLLQVLDYRNKHELFIKLNLEIREFGTPAAQAAMNRVEDAIVGFIRKQVEAALERGELKPCDPELTAFVLLKLYVAFVSDWNKKHKPLDNEEIAKWFHLYLAEGLQQGEKKR